MPCPQRSQAALQETEATEDGIKMYTWRAVRRQHLRKLRKQARYTVLFMALLEIIRVGIIDLVFRGRHGTQAPGPEDYGIAYNVAYLLAWLFMCLCAIIYDPLFSWWIDKLFPLPNDWSPSSNPTRGGNVVAFLQKLNMIFLLACVGLSMILHFYYVVSAFVYVDAKPVDPSVKNPHSLNSRRNWVVRLLLLEGIVATMTVGKGVFMILEEMDLAKVKPWECLTIVMPILVNLGILLGSAMQFKTEQRRTKKMAARKAADAEATSLLDGP